MTLGAISTPRANPSARRRRAGAALSAARCGHSRVLACTAEQQHNKDMTHGAAQARLCRIGCAGEACERGAVPSAWASRNVCCDAIAARRAGRWGEEDCQTGLPDRAPRTASARTGGPNNRRQPDVSPCLRLALCSNGAPPLRLGKHAEDVTASRLQAPAGSCRRVIGEVQQAVRTGAGYIPRQFQPVPKQAVPVTTAHTWAHACPAFLLTALGDAGTVSPR